MNEIIKSFNYEPNEVRIALVNEEPHFCLKDVCDILAIGNISDTAKRLDDGGIAKIEVPTTSGDQEMWFVNEPNLYRVIFRSNKKEAKTFQDWVFNEVLPSIRKNGIYVQTTEVQMPELMTKVNELEHRLESFVTLNSFEARKFQKVIAKRVYELGLEPEARPLAFAEIHREIRDRFGVPSYRDVARLDFDKATTYVSAWIPKKVSA